MSLNPLELPREYKAIFAVTFGTIGLIGYIFFRAERIDATTPKTYQASLTKIKATLSSDELAAFETGLTEIAKESRAVGNKQDAADQDYGVRNRVHGMTANDVIKRGKRIIQVREREIAKKFGHLRPQSDN